MQKNVGGFDKSVRIIAGIILIALGILKVLPYSIVIAKNSKAKKVFSNEINREANKYAEQNIKLNKVKDKIELINFLIKKPKMKLQVLVFQL